LRFVIALMLLSLPLAADAQLAGSPDDILAPSGARLEVMPHGPGAPRIEATSGESVDEAGPPDFTGALVPSAFVAAWCAVESSPADEPTTTTGAAATPAKAPTCPAAGAGMSLRRDVPRWWRLGFATAMSMQRSMFVGADIIVTPRDATMSAAVLVGGEFVVDDAIRVGEARLVVGMRIGASIGGRP
jgi:hypothetical protein